MKAIKNEESGLTFIVQDDRNKMMAELKAAGVKIGATSLKQLLEGSRDTVVGFKLIEVAEIVPEDKKPDDNAGQQDANTNQADNQGGDDTQTQQDNQGDANPEGEEPHNRRADDPKDDEGGDNQGQDNGAGGTTNRVPGHGAQGFASMDAEKQREIASEGGKQSHKNDDTPENRKPDPIPGNQGGTTEQHQNAGAQSHKNTNGTDNSDDQGEDDRAQANDGNQTSNQTPQDNNQGNNQAAPKPASNGGGRTKSIKTVDPKGKLKPVRSGTKIANGLEMLLKGATIQELEDADVSDDVYDFCNRRVTKRGYGIKMDGDKVMLVIPNNGKIAYSNAAEGTAEEQAPADKPTEEVKEETGDGGDEGQGDQPQPDDQPEDEAAEQK